MKLYKIKTTRLTGGFDFILGEKIENTDSIFYFLFKIKAKINILQ